VLAAVRPSYPSGSDWGDPALALIDSKYAAVVAGSTPFPDSYSLSTASSSSDRRGLASGRPVGPSGQNVIQGVWQRPGPETAPHERLTVGADLH
jgi:hypothetical protein